MKPARRLAHRVIAGQAFVLDPQARKLHSLNPTASRIWELLGKGTAENEISETIAAEFEVDVGAAEADTRRFMAQIKDLGLLA